MYLKKIASYINNIFTIISSWKIPASRFVLILSLINTVIFNGALYSFLASNLDLFSFGGISIAASAVVLVFFTNVLFISILSVVAFIAVKPLFIITSAINSVALYYTLSYKVILDKTMMGNIFNTRGSEVFDLLTPTLLLYIILFAVIPSLFIWKLVIKPVNKIRIVLNFFLVFVFSIVFLYLNSASWLWIDKYSKILGGKTLPWSYIGNTARYYYSTSKSNKNPTLLPVGKFADNKKMVVVLIIGEAARDNNFSLYGYSKNTNPLLQSENILVFNKTTSCSTYTTASVACMLSHNINKSGYEPLPSYLTRLGANVIWRSNNWGEPSINVSKYQKSTELSKKCIGKDCAFDEVLLTKMNKEIKTSDKQKIFMALHTSGSHGPSYYSKYPARFEKFTPVCRYEELSKCTQQELINAYDNTILYTDYFLHKAIQDLKKLKNTPVMLIYVSDHGESLGENGLYLHGLPFSFAPKYQKEVPFIIWRSEALIKLQGKNKAPNQTGEFGHENIFHTIIGAFGIKTDAYNAENDIFGTN